MGRIRESKRKWNFSFFLAGWGQQGQFYSKLPIYNNSLLLSCNIFCAQVSPSAYIILSLVIYTNSASPCTTDTCIRYKTFGGKSVLAVPS